MNLKIKKGHAVFFLFILFFTISVSLVTAEKVAIKNCEDLQNIKEEGIYYLANDINCSETREWNCEDKECKGFEPIGGEYGEDFFFEGSLNGKGNTIYGLYINRSEGDGIGLFSQLWEGSRIKNFVLRDVFIIGDEEVGGLAGSGRGTIIYNVEISGNISGKEQIGGLMGDFGSEKEDAAIKYSFSNVNILGEKSIGGMVGWNEGKISNSYSLGKIVASESNIGGLVGWNEGTILNSYSISEMVVAEDLRNVGGLVGNNYENGKCINSYWDIDKSGQKESECGEGKSTGELKEERIYEKWDFDNIWTINSSENEGYAYLDIKKGENEDDKRDGGKNKGFFDWIIEWLSGLFGGRSSSSGEAEGQVVDGDLGLEQTSFTIKYNHFLDGEFYGRGKGLHRYIGSDSRNDRFKHKSIGTRSTEKMGEMSSEVITIGRVSDKGDWIIDKEVSCTENLCHKYMYNGSKSHWERDKIEKIFEIGEKKIAGVDAKCFRFYSDRLVYKLCSHPEYFIPLKIVYEKVKLKPVSFGKGEEESNRYIEEMNEMYEESTKSASRFLEGRKYIATNFEIKDVSDSKFKVDESKKSMKELGEEMQESFEDIAKEMSNQMGDSFEEN